MIYVSDRTLDLINKLLKHFRENRSGPSRILQTDVVYEAVEEYAKKLGVK